MFLIESPHKSYRIYEGFGFSCKGRIAILFIFFFNPSVLRHLPYILCCKNTPQCCGTRQGRRVLVFSILALPFIFTPSFFYGYFPYRQGGRIEMLFLIFFSIPSPFGPLPYIFALQKHRGGLYGSFLHFIRYFTSLFPLPCPVALWEVALAI